MNPNILFIFQVFFQSLSKHNTLCKMPLLKSQSQTDFLAFSCEIKLKTERNTELYMRVWQVASDLFSNSLHNECSKLPNSQIHSP
jgi:hypothetical protein